MESTGQRNNLKGKIVQIKGSHKYIVSILYAKNRFLSNMFVYAES